jgi:signal peptidase I
MKRAIKITSSIMLLCLAILAGAVIYFVFQSKGDVQKAPDIFGYKPLTILSNSMQPTFNAGDIILINVDKEPEKGDVITYKHPDGIYVTHRAINKEVKDGTTYFEAKGDNNNVDDKIQIPNSDVIGVQTFIIPKAGHLAKFVSGPIGFSILIGLPILLFLIIEMFERLGVVEQKDKNKAA